MRVPEGTAYEASAGIACWTADSEVTMTNGARGLPVPEIRAMLERGDPVTFIDSRNPIAWASSKVKIRGAVRVPIDEVPEHLPALPRDHHLIVYCT
jgi:hypothetical protein